MAISRYSVTRSTFTSGNPKTYTHDAGTGSDRLLLIFGLYFNLSGTDIISNITYNGVSATKVNAVDNADNAYYSSMWYQIAPSTGSNTVSASFSAAPNLSRFISISYDGADQTTQPNVSGGVSTNTNYSVSVTTTNDNTFLVAGSLGNVGPVASTNATRITAGGTESEAFEHSSNPLTPAGSYSMTINHSGAHNGVHWFVVNPAATGGGPTNNALAFCPF